MFAFADMMHLFADEFAGLGGGSFALACISSGSVYCSLFWHNKFSPCSNKDQSGHLAMGKNTLRPLPGRRGQCSAAARGPA